MNGIRSWKFISLIILLILSEVLYLSLYSTLAHTIELYFYVSVINSLLFLCIWLLLRNLQLRPAVAVPVILTGALIFRLSVIFMQPTASDDINRYIWDGKVSANGINPYRYAPDAPELNHLHSDLLPGSVNFPSMKTIYPPLAQLLFYSSYTLFGESYTGFKFFLFICEIITLLLLYLLLKERKIPEYYLAIYALCPLPVMQFMVDGHIDALGLPLLVLSILLFYRGRRMAYYAALGLSISTKLISGMILPVTVNEREKNIAMKFIMGIVPLAVFALTYLPFLGGGVFPFESLATFTANWSFNGSAFSLFYSVIPDNQKARLVCAALFVIYAAYIFFSKKEMNRKIYLMFLSFLLLSPTVHPWYVTWLAVILPFCFSWSGFSFIMLINIANFVVIDYKLKGVWHLGGTALLIEYLPVYAFLLWETLKEFRKPGQTG